jgi:hypothetical protein
MDISGSHRKKKLTQEIKFGTHENMSETVSVSLSENRLVCGVEGSVEENLWDQFPSKEVARNHNMINMPPIRAGLKRKGGGCETGCSTYAI